MQALHERAHREIRELLTTEQAAKFQRMLDEMDDRHHGAPSE